MDTPTIESLLAHHDQVARLARQLVADPHRADDVAQEAWVTALQRPPRSGTHLRAWLGRVVRNTARDLGRAEARRRRHEAAATPARPAGDTAEVVARVGLQRRLASAVLDLDEPYRTALLLRFFDDRKPARIARDLGRPVATVHTWIQRGLAQLRSRLEKDLGHDWAQALAPLLGLGVPARAGVLLVAACLVAATAATAVFVPWNDPAPSPTGAGRASTLADATRRVRTHEPEIRTDLGGGIRPMTTQAGRAARLLDLDGRPVARAMVEFDDPAHPTREGFTIRMGRYSITLHPSTLARYADATEVLRRLPDCPDPDALARLVRGETIALPRARTDRDGRFELADTATLERLRLVDDPRLLIGRAELASGARVLFATAGQRLRGTVRDPLGRPVPGAAVVVAIPTERAPDVQARLVLFRTWRATTDALGRFDLDRVPAVPGVDVVVSKEGFQPRQLPTAELDGRDLACTLAEEPPPRRHRVHGRVLCPGGAPAAHALVCCGAVELTADESGRFSRLLVDAPAAPLVAVHSGYQPAFVSDLGTHLAGGDPLELRLGPPPRTVRGTLVDAGGTALAGHRVVLADATPLGAVFGRTVEGVLRGPGTPDVETGADGSFELGGLCDRAYRIRAYDPRTLLIVDGEIPAAGDTVLLRAPVAPFFDRVDGVVTDRTGAPVEGVELELTAELLRSPAGARGLVRADRAVTDRVGRFTFRDVPRQHVRASVVHRDLATLHRPVTARHLAITVHRILRFRLRVAPGTADRFEVRDAAGRPVPVTVEGGEPSTRPPLTQGDPPVECAVEDTAASVTLFRGGREVRTAILHLRPGTLDVVTL